MILICCLVVNNLAAQRKWGIYLGPHKDSLYTVSTAYIDRRDNYRFFHFMSFPKMNFNRSWKATKENIIRLGLVLPAKSTFDHQQGGVAIFGNSTDSVFISYWIKSQVVRNGRSAALSILNLLSKQQDKMPQDAPHFYESSTTITGFICLGDEQFEFDRRQIILGKDTLRLVPARQFINSKTGKIKLREPRCFYCSELLKGKTALAALSNPTSAGNYYLLKSLEYKEKLLISAFLFISHLRIEDVEQEMEVNPVIN